MILVSFQCAPNFDYSEMTKYMFYPLSAVLAEHYYSPLTCRELLTQWHSATSQKTWIISSTTVTALNLANVIKFDMSTGVV